ncbi:MAG: hypothetical protein Q9201_006378 [Fulgogasparrea decipioides]
MEGSSKVKTDVYQYPPVDVTSEPGYELVVEKHGTERDAHDMARMGKIQVLRVKLYLMKTKLLLSYFQRNFDYYSILGFSMILMATWENLNATTTFGLNNGGTAGAIYIYIFTFFGFGLAVVSMAEMSSM